MAARPPTITLAFQEEIEFKDLTSQLPYSFLEGFLEILKSNFHLYLRASREAEKLFTLLRAKWTFGSQ